jgi:hypothetical protein
MKVVRSLIVVLLALLVTFSACKKKQEDIIADTKEKKEKIEQKLNDYTSKRVDDLTYKNKGAGTINGYFRDKEVKKIHAEHFTQNGRAFTDYYFDDGMLIYVLKQDYLYNRPNTYSEEVAKERGDSVWYDDKKTQLTINSYYFHKNKLIKWEGVDGNSQPVNTSDFAERESAIWAEAIILLKQVNDE